MSHKPILFFTFAIGFFFLNILMASRKSLQNALAPQNVLLYKLGNSLFNKANLRSFNLLKPNRRKAVLFYSPEI